MDLSHWDLVDKFTGWEAACLAGGIDPNLFDDSPPEQKAKAELIYRELMNAYNSAVASASYFLTGKRDENETIYSIFLDHQLPSSSLLMEANICLKNGKDLRTEKFFDNDDEQRFGRAILDDWFTFKNYQPTYSFIHRTNQAQQDDNQEKKQLATKERTSLLTLIALLAEEARIDVSKPSKAATTIVKLAETQGLQIAQRTIEEHLKRIPDALQRRSKAEA